MAQKWTQRSLIKALGEMLASNDGRLTKSGYENSRKQSQPPASLFVERFGSWSKALEAAEEKQSRRISDEELLELLAEAVDAHDEKLTMPLFQAWTDSPNPWIYYKRFGTWTKAMKMVGGMARGAELERQRVIGDLQTAAAAIERQGKSISQATYNEWLKTLKNPKGTRTPAGVDAAIGIFGSWTEALNAAGLEAVSVPTNWTDEQVISALQRWDADRDHSLPATRSAYRHWREKQRNQSMLPPYRSVRLSGLKSPSREAWEYACERAGIRASHKTKNQFSDAQLMSFLTRAMKVHGDGINASEYQRWVDAQVKAGRTVASQGTLKRRYGGSWADVLSAHAQVSKVESPA